MGLLLQDMDSMVRTPMTMEKDIRDHGASEMRVLVARGRRVSLLLVRERSQRLLIGEGFRATTIMDKVKLGLPIRRDR